MEEDSEKTYIENPIYTIGYPNYEEESVSFDILKSIELLEGFDFNHLCSTEEGSSGSPILNLYNNKIIGIHKESYRESSKNMNKSSFLRLSITEYSNVI